MDLGLSGKRALVTGATRGIGRAVAETLLREGASVAVCARSAEGVEAAAAELTALAGQTGGGAVVASAVDAGDLESLTVWVESSAEQFGGIDVYVHNTSAKPQRSLENWISNFEVDLLALVGGVGTAAEHLADGGGSVICIGTTAAAEHFGPGSGSYTALKAAAVNWTLGQAQVLGAKGVRCNVVTPGPIMVPGGDWDRIQNAKPDFFKATRKTHPGGELGTPQDVANAVAFLASDAARHVNGANLAVDGGFLKRVDY